MFHRIYTFYKNLYIRRMSNVCLCGVPERLQLVRARHKNADSSVPFVEQEDLSVRSFGEAKVCAGCRHSSLCGILFLDHLKECLLCSAIVEKNSTDRFLSTLRQVVRIHIEDFATRVVS